jgi:hypothetical protein
VVEPHEIDQSGAALGDFYGTIASRMWNYLVDEGVPHSDATQIVSQWVSSTALTLGMR